MKTAMRRLLWILPLFLLVLFLLLGVVADAWLESSGGRKMLQRELGKSLGLPVRIGADFHLEFIPRLQISGRGLEIGQPGKAGLWVVCDGYTVAIELAPFIHREVSIANVDLRGGTAGFNSAGYEAEAETAGIGQEFNLPQVALLAISDFRILLEQQDRSFLIKRLQLTNFQPGRAAGFYIDAGWIDGQEEKAGLSLRGGLQVGASLSSSLEVREMMVNLGGTALTGLTGEWQFDRPTARLKGRMVWKQAPHAAELQLELASMTPPTGAVHARYQRATTEPSSLSVRFTFLPEHVLLQNLVVELAGQSIGGDGCLLLSEEPVVNLSLQAEDLDLDRVYSILPANEDGSAELPFVPAIRLDVRKARYAGADAADVTVHIGADPDCGAPPGSNG